MKNQKARWLNELRVIGCVIVIAATLGACSPPQGEATEPSAGTSITEEALGSGLPEFSRDIEAWALPLDEYGLVPPPVMDFAEQLLLSECLASAGVHIKIHPVDPDRPFPQTKNVMGRNLFTAEIAQNYGYHSAPALHDAPNEPPAVLTPEQNQAFEECRAKLSDTIPPLVYGELAQSIGRGTFEGARLDPAVRATFPAWRKCMEGVTGLTIPASPLEIPTFEMVSAFNLDKSSVLVDGQEVSSEEAAVATRDFECQVSSGFRGTFYEAEWQRQVGAFEDNIEALTFAGDEYAKRLGAALEVIAERG